MDKIVRVSGIDLTRLMERLSDADMRGASVRFQVGEDGRGRWLKYDSGAGWTPPIYERS